MKFKVESLNRSIVLSESVIFQDLLTKNKIWKVNSFKNRQVRRIFKKRASDFAYSSRDSRVLRLLEIRKAQRNFTKIHGNFWVRTKHGNLCKFPETFIPKVENSSGNLPKWAKIARNRRFPAGREAPCWKPMFLAIFVKKFPVFCLFIFDSSKGFLAIFSFSSLTQA